MELDENTYDQSRDNAQRDDKEVEHKEEESEDSKIESVEKKEKVIPERSDQNEYVTQLSDKISELEMKYIEQRVLEYVKRKVAGTEAVMAWREINLLQHAQAQRLSEQLRLILEPKKASALKGDYRTGKRLNMRKIIPYIASRFQRDRIWLRRTKPRARTHTICIALDDSESMIDNESKKVAFESVALLSSALKLIEIKNFGLLRFGAETEIVSSIGEELNDQKGGEIIEKFTFEQQSTDIVEMLNSTSQLMRLKGSESEKLLIIVSDGRGIFSKGRAQVAEAIKKAKSMGIFIILIIVDNPKAEKSIKDIKSASFVDGKVVWKSYLDDFPFPYYLILRNVEKMPDILADALRQWFQLIEAEN